MNSALSWKDIDAGDWHSLGIKKDGTLWAWGYNNFGQLGNGSYDIKYSPTQIGTDSTWLKVVAGFEYSIALKSDGSLWAWGRNLDGQLGIGTQLSQSIPIQIGSDQNWTQAFASGYSHTLAIKTDGSLWAWGENISGQLGNGSNMYQYNLIQIGLNTNWIQVGVSPYSSIGLREDGSLWTWGSDNAGQLGNGKFYSDTFQSTPNEIICPISNSSCWQQIATGDDAHTIAIKNDGTLWAWGNNRLGQLGNGTNVNQNKPIQIGSESNWMQVLAAGADYSLALRSDGSLWAWGYNEVGQLGDGTNKDKNTPTRIGADFNWVKLSAGLSHNLAIDVLAQLWVWGSNDGGELGDGSYINKNIPTQLGKDSWWQVATGWDHSLAIESGGALWSWGYNLYGQLGDGTNITRSTPVRIGSDYWKHITASRNLSLGIKK
ncbi:MAG: hypothetical protein IPO72_01725 [Saprospiraceae bacterium]|nr:hypothetical protein [Candidatus Vicinibacter affinis]